MGIIEAISLFAIMVSLAAIPSTSVALVVTRSATLGVTNGVATSLGIVLGDLVFILLAVLGLSAVAETMGEVFIVIRHLGAAYLLWIGYSLLTSRKDQPIRVKETKSRTSLVASLLAGFLLTLGDVKAIFFYISLFPAFMDLSALTITDLFVIILITVVAVGGVKVAYAFSANEMVKFSTGLKTGSKLGICAKKAAGSFMLGAGAYLIVKG
jgi:threonine/homoserine/homoserine lactone efflux protein